MTVDNEQIFGKLKTIDHTLQQIIALLRDVHGMTTEQQEPPINYATAQQKQTIASLRHRLDMHPMAVEWFDTLRAIDAAREIERLNCYIDDEVEA
jgi:hypothetical protein